jgi:hypothetical protein
MELTPKNRPNLAEFTDEGRLHHHIMHCEPFILWETGTKRVADPNTVPIIGNTTWVERVLLENKAAAKKHTNVMSRAAGIKRLKTTHTCGLPVAYAIACRRYDW